jgi:hypothetical protein
MPSLRTAEMPWQSGFAIISHQLVAMLAAQASGTIMPVTRANI